MDKRRRAAVANALRRTRDRLNDNGRHWIKRRMQGKNEADEPAWCALGGIDASTREGTVRDETIIALAREIKPAALDRIEQVYGRYGRDHVANMARSIIITYNDAYGRRWSDIARRFDKAEKAVRNA